MRKPNFLILFSYFLKNGNLEIPFMIVQNSCWIGEKMPTVCNLFLNFCWSLMRIIKKTVDVFLIESSMYILFS